MFLVKECVHCVACPVCAVYSLCLVCPVCFVSCVFTVNQWLHFCVLYLKGVTMNTVEGRTYAYEGFYSIINFVGDNLGSQAIGGWQCASSM